MNRTEKHRASSRKSGQLSLLEGALLGAGRENSRARQDHFGKRGTVQVEARASGPKCRDWMVVREGRYRARQGRFPCELNKGVGAGGEY